MPLTDKQESALKQAAQCAVTAEAATGCPAAITLAQWAIESGFGAHCPGNNPFGIKAVHGEPSQALKTTEVVHGQHVSVTANFAVYPSLAIAFVEHGTLLTQGLPYVDAFRRYRADNNLDKFIDAVATRYATDESYSKKLKTILQMPAVQQALYDARKAAV